MLVLLVVAGCASRAAPCTTLKAENKRLNDDLADARRHEAETDAKLKALELKVAQLDQATKTRESELAKLRTDSSASARELADARAKVDAAAKKLPPVCPPGTMLDATGTICMQGPPPVVTPPVAPPVAPSPVVARVIKIEVTTDGVLCTLGAGSA